MLSPCKGVCNLHSAAVLPTCAQFASTTCPHLPVFSQGLVGNLHWSLPALSSAAQCASQDAMSCQNKPQFILPHSAVSFYEMLEMMAALVGRPFRVLILYVSVVRSADVNVTRAPSRSSSQTASRFQPMRGAFWNNLSMAVDRMRERFVHNLFYC